MSEHGSLFGLLVLFVFFIFAILAVVIGMSVISASHDNRECYTSHCCNNQNSQIKEITIQSKYEHDVNSIFKLASFYVVTDKCETYRVRSPQDTSRSVRPSFSLWNSLGCGGTYNATINCDGEIICINSNVNSNGCERCDTKDICGCSQC
jgi:type II secretory pathway pseudopilin PulG